MNCDHCGASTTNGLALCQSCRAWLLVNLEFIPVYFRNLSRWRPSSASGIRRVPGSWEPANPNAVGSDRIGDALDESHADLTGWARSLADDRPQLARVIARILTFEEEPSVRLICALLTKYIDTLTTLPWVRAIVTAISEIEQRLREETERAIPGWYAGACRLCKVPTYVVPGLTWVTCMGCGATTYARDHLDTILEEARGWVARPMRIAEAVVALVDTEQSVPRLHKRISKWGERGQIAALRRTHRTHVYDAGTDAVVVRTEEVGYARYRFGEVVDLLLREGATRFGEQAQPALLQRESC